MNSMISFIRVTQKELTHRSKECNDTYYSLGKVQERHWRWESLPTGTML